MSHSPTPQKHKFVDPAEFTPHFAWKSSPAKSGHALRHPERSEGSRPDRRAEVFCEKVALEEAAKKFGTPLYLYSSAAIKDAYTELHRGLGAQSHTLCFAAKSNGNLSILKTLAKLGSGFDIVSGGELDHLQRIGVPGNKIVFSGVGKDRQEIRQALQYKTGSGSKTTGILLFNVESEAELEVLVEESSKHIAKGGAAPAVSIRVNPDVQAGAHPKISTGRYEHKFGVDWSSAKNLYLAHRDSKFIRWQGLSSHIGSQITDLAPFRLAFSRLAGFVGELRAAGIDLRYLDFGGGLGVRYTNEPTPSRTKYAQMVAKLIRKLGVHLLLEPGRSIIAPAGVLLTRVIYTKTNNNKTFVVVDSAMNDLMRPALYGAVHPITKVTRTRNEKSTPTNRVDVVGPVCETGDCFLRDWPLNEVKSGDLLAIWTAGAYGMSQTSNYNARCRPAEVLVENNRVRLIRRRETQDDILRTDVLFR